LAVFVQSPASRQRGRVLLEVDLERIGRGAKVPAPHHSHQRCKQFEGTLWVHLQLMVDACRVTLGRESKTVPTLEPRDVRNDPHSAIPLEFFELLNNLPKPSDIPLERCALANLAFVESARGTNRRVPVGEVAAVDDSVENRLGGSIDDLRSGDD